MKCPICKEEIEDGAKKCPRCGSYARKLTRVWGIIRSVLQICTFIAAIVLLWCHQEQLNLQRKSVERISEQFIIENRPRIEIIATRMDLADTSWLIYVDFTNSGIVDAEEVLFYFVLKFEDSLSDTALFSVARPLKITRARTQTVEWTLPALPKINFFCSIDVRYTWKIQNLHYQDKKFFRFIYREDLKKYIVRLLTKEQIEKFW